MYAFIMKKKPRSIQAKNRERYMDEIAAAFDSQQFKGIPLSGSLYARVYYFHSGPSTIDADNMSKPIIDALIDHAYIDDNIVIHRTAARVRIGEDPIREFSLSNFPDDKLKEFIDALEDENLHLLYIEVGIYKHKMLRFGEFNNGA